MTLLIIGVVLWTVVHLFPSVMPGVRAGLIEKLGENLYKGLFSLDLIIAIVLMVIGWRSAGFEPVYNPPLLGSLVVPVLMYLSFILFAAANAPGNIKRLVRHPMLTGMVVWSLAHLLANGDLRSVILFGGLGAWAAISIFTISRRDGAWEKPDAAPISRDLVTVVASAVVFAVIAYFHKAVFGVSALPGIL